MCPYISISIQIGVLNAPPPNGGDDYAMTDNCNFPHHTYAADGPPPEYNIGPNFSDVFTVSNTRNMGNNNKGVSI